MRKFAPNAFNGGALPALIEAMCRPEFYPEPPATVELRQTHISYVLLAGACVYKIKKPVHFPFLDCSSLAERYRLCNEELRLNRRLAPSVYLGVFPVVSRQGGFALGAEATEFDPEASEYVVKMRRLPEERMLDRMIARKQVGANEIRALAAGLAAFHREAPDTKSWTYGSAAALWRMIIGDLAQNERFVGYTLAEREFAALQEHCRAFLMSHWELFNERARDRRVREVHGDLRCESVCLEDPPAIFDCIEFSERLRYCDGASEIAFLAMDLERLEAAELADELVAAYAEAADDPAAPTLIPFYKCWRACVRGKVESLRSLEAEIPEPERRRAREMAQRYFRLALQYTRASSPALIVVCGPAGTGKSTVARLLQRHTGFEILNSDRIRKRLAGLASATRVREEYKAGIYSPDFTRRTYQKLAEEAEARLREGAGVIVDATFKDPAERRRFHEIAVGRGMPALFVECEANEREILRRLRERELRGGNVSDATVEVYLRQRTEFTPIAELPPRSHLVIDTTEGGEAIARSVEQALERLLAPAPAKPDRHPSA